MFIHREAFPLGPPLLEYIIAKIYKVPIIYDFDDAIWLANTSAQNFLVAALKFHSKVKKICSWSTKVSVGNSFLGEYAKNFNDSVQIIPTTIDTDYHVAAVERPSNIRLVIGWTGSHSTTRYLTELENVFVDLQRSHEFDILIISNQRPDWNIENYHFVKWSRNQEIEQLDKIDIGIMPLEKSEWEKGKCGV